MYIPKKLVVPPANIVEAGGAQCCGLFTLPASIHRQNNTNSNISFLIDTGSCLSILPKSFGLSTIPSGSLRAANNSSIPTFGTVTLTFTLSSVARTLTWSFTIADTIQPILGADFFDNFGFLVDCRNHRILIGNNISSSNRLIPNVSNIFSASVFSCTTTNLESESLFISEIPKKYPACLSKSSTASRNNPVFHHIPTTPSPPYRTRKRDLPLSKLQAVEKLFLELESSGVVRRSSSPWASAIHVVSKPDGSFRPCGDYRFLNSITVHDSYPMPLITDIMNKLTGSTCFSKIDLNKAFHQIPVLPEDIAKTAVITPFGLFEYIMMPFGLRNAAQSFQRHIDYVLKDVTAATAYLDDILIFSSDSLSHKKDVHDVLTKLNEYNLIINLKKCSFFQEQVQFLGHLVSKSGVRPLPSKIETISKISLPKNVTALRSFLGAVNFYHRFIPKASSLLAPLSSLATGKKTSPILWSDSTIETFNSVKERLSTLVSLKFYDPSLELQLVTDASDVAIGAVLHQISSVGQEPIEFFSQKMNSAQRNYSAFDRELLAIHDAVKHFRNILDGRSFSILTDHKPLIHLNTLKNPSPRQLRHITFLSEFNFAISHLSGKSNVVADFFSRPDISSISRLPLFSDTPLESFTISSKDLSYFGERAKLINSSYYDISIPGSPRPILPVQLRKKAFDSIHLLHHPGNKKSFELMHTRFIWPHMRRDIKIWCSECRSCQQNKVTKHINPPIIRFPTGNRFEVLHIDLVGPLPMSQGKTYIFTMIDRKTRWVEAIPIASISATNVAKHLISSWFSRYGIPDHIITDQGTQFEGQLFDALSSSYGFKHIHTTAYHPQANGMIERFHRSLKTSLRCLSIKGDWVSALPMVLLGWRNTIHSASGTSPAQLLFGMGTAFPSEFFELSRSVSDTALNTARQHFLESDTNPSFGPSSAKKSHIPKSLYSAKQVWLRSRDTFHMKPRYIGPFVVVKLKDNNTIVILKDGKHLTINIDKVKPAFGFSETQSDVNFSSSKETQPKVTIETPEPPSVLVPVTPTPPLLPLHVTQSRPVLRHLKPPYTSILKSTEIVPQRTSATIKKSVRFANWSSVLEHPRPGYLPSLYSRTKL